METTQNAAPEVAHVPAPMLPKLKGTGQIIKEGWKLWSGRLGLITALSVLPYAAAFIIGFVAVAIFLITGGAGIIPQLMLGGPTTGQFILGAIVFIVIIAAIIIISLLFQLAILYAIADETKMLGVGALLKHSWKKLGSFFWVGLLTYLIMGGAMILFLIPFFIVAPMISLAIFVFVTEDVRGLNAIVKSREYTKGYWLPIVGRTILLMLCLIAVSLISSAILGALHLTGFDPKTIAPTGNALMLAVVGQFIQVAINIFMNSFMFACFYSLFKTVRDSKGQVSVETSTSRNWIKGLAIVGILFPFIYIGALTFFLNGAREKARMATSQAEQRARLQMEMQGYTQDQMMMKFQNMPQLPGGQNQ